MLQALVLLHQTMREQKWLIRLLLNSGVVQFGAVSDVVDQVYGRNNFKNALFNDNGLCAWEFEDEQDDLSMVAITI